MKCLVSGATGFVGSQLCQRLAARGDTVTPLSRSGRALASGMPTVALDLAVCEPKAATVKGQDVVFHLAGIAHQRAEEPAYRELNTRATLRLARLAAAQGVKCFVFLSSVKAMGPSGTGRVRSESDCLTPRGDYGRSKWEAECALREEFTGGDMSVVIVRPTLIYGPQPKGNLAMLARATRRGLPRPPELGSRSMLALADLVELLCLLADRPPPGVHTWIACDDEGYSTRWIYDQLRQAGGRGPGPGWLPLWGWRLAAGLLDRVSPQGDDPMFDKLFGTELYSNASLRAATSWQPRPRLEEVLKVIATGQGNSAE